MNVRDIINGIVDQKMNKHEMYSVVCTVDSVDTGDRTCTVTPVNGGAEIQDVRIQAGIGSAVGLFIEPKVDSFVLVSFLSKEMAYVAMFSEIENVYLDVESGGEIILNGGSNNGLVKVADLVTKLNNIENDINTLKAVFSGWTPVPNDGGAALKTAASAWYGSTLTTTVQADLENEDVKH